jgi:hypothetical protein
MEGKRAAVDVDKIAETPLGKVSAVDFLQALGHGGVDAATFGRIWPEKKKLELWESEDLSAVKTGRVINIIKVEKKKVELEVPDRINPRIRWPEEVVGLIDQRIDERLQQR